MNIYAAFGCIAAAAILAQITLGRRDDGNHPGAVFGAVAIVAPAVAALAQGQLFAGACLVGLGLVLAAWYRRWAIQSA